MKKKIDYILLINVILLSIIGLLMIYSASYIWADYKFHDSFHYLKYQAVFVSIGIFLMMIISKIDYHLYEKYSNKILLFCLLLLVLVLVPGIGKIRNGSRSWFGIGPFGIQPSEAAKLGLIIFTSKYLSRSEKEIKSMLKGAFPILLITLIFFGLIMLQPDLGTGMILVISIVSLLFIAGIDMRFFLVSGVIGLIGVVILILIAPYRLNRITSYLDPWSDSLGTGFQIIQSLYAIGPEGLLGTGYLNSIQKHFYLPEPQTDFIFAIIAEEFGILGAIVIVLLFSNLLYRGIRISNTHTNKFAKYLSFGMIFQIIFQALLNLSVVIGLIPVTGVTLPFLSYGGSSLLVSMVSIGIILNISKETRR